MPTDSAMIIVSKDDNMRNFKSVEEMCETLLRGNEIQFSYNSQLFCIFSHFEGECITGYDIEKAYEDLTFVKLSDLKNFLILGKRFEDIFDSIIIIDRVI